MSKYYSVGCGADVGGRAGVAYIKDFAALNLLPEQGWVKEWQTKQFALKNGEYTDYLPTNIGCRLCSKKLRDILDRFKSEIDVIQWLDAEVESVAGEMRSYYILHFPELEDLLDRKKSKSVRNILTKHVIDTKKCDGHEVFSYIGGSKLSFVVSQRVREELKIAKCQGLIYLQISSKKKSYIPKLVRRLHCVFDGKRILTNENKIKQDKQYINFSHLEGLNIPRDLIDFIRNGKTLSYDEEKCIVGRVELVSIESLFPGRIYIEANGRSQKKGTYTIPAIDLVAECEGFEAWGILVWLPDIQMFGTWDSDHRILRVFPKAKWSDIIKEPVRYLNTLWEPQKVENTVFVPSNKYPFTKEMDA